MTIAPCRRRRLRCNAALVSAACMIGTAASAPAHSAAPADARPWMNPALAPDRRADLVEAQMTLDEKLLLVDGHYAVPANWKTPANVPPPEAVGSAGYVPGVPRLGIPALQESDAGVGVADPVNGETGQPVRGTKGYSTPLPSGLNAAATWNPYVAYQAGAMIGTEAHQEGFNVLLAGGVDLAREPRNGRNFEYAGEDPLLAGAIVGAQVRGIQDQHVVSTLKHYAINDQETGRNTLSANLNWGAARESDLLAFEIAIERGQPGSIMCSYNRVHAIYACSSHHLLTDVLKNDWKYPGWVLSDWGAVHATTDATAGLDQESGDFFDQPNVWFSAANLRAALADGSVKQARLDDMVHRILRSMFANGLFDDPPVIVPIDAQADAAVAQAGAEQGMVLLKNAGDQLPLDRAVGSIAVIGSHADVGVMEGGGSSEVWPVGGPAVPPDNLNFPHPIIYDPSSPLAAIRKQAPGATVRYADGTDAAAAAKLATSAKVAVVFVHQWLAESFDVADLALPDNQDALVSAVSAANPNTIVVLETGNPVTMPWLSNVRAVLEAWYPGARGGEAIARVLFGAVNPSGRLPITFPRSVQQLPRPKLDGLANPNALFDVNYDVELAAVGYKWFDKHGLSPLFPFGFGLSYTQFAYSNLLVATADNRLAVSFDVENVGTRRGWDTPQVYVGLPFGVGEAPRRLAAFDKVDLPPGETRHVTLPVDPRLLATFDSAAVKWRVHAGRYDVSLGASSRDLRLQKQVTLASEQLAP